MTMTKNRLAIVVLGLCGLIQSVFAEEREKEWTDSPIANVVLIESLFGVNAYLASLDPRAYGVAGAVLFPIGAINGESSLSNATLWVGLASAEALALYNIGLDEDEMSDSEIFKNNFIGWHVVTGIIAVTGYFSGDFNRNKKIALNYLAEPRGGRFMLSYRF